MPSPRCATLAVIAASAVAVASHAADPNVYVDVAMLQPESRAVLEEGTRSFVSLPAKYSPDIRVSRTRQVKPLVDFAFAFSRAVAGSHHSNVSGGSINRKQNQVAASMQHQDLVIAELEARESQIASDLEAKAAVDNPAPIQGRIAVPTRRPAPVNLDKAWPEVAPKAAPEKGWSGMTLAIEDVALRFVDEGGAAPVQYR